MKSTPVLWTAMITPMLSSYQVDYKSLEELLVLQMRADNGVLLLGSTGESLSFSEKEKKEILSFVLQKKMNIPLMVGIGGIHLPSTLAWLDYLEDFNVDCYLMTTPPYTKPGKWGQYHWFKTLLDRASKPCVLYNVPSRSGCSLNYKTVELLNEHPRFWGIKEASSLVADFLQYKKIASGAKIFGGDDALFPEFSSYGVDGLISVAANVWPFATKSYVTRAMERELKDAFAWRVACESLFTTSNPVPVKSIMAYKGQITDKTVRPPLSNEDLNSLESLISADTWVKKWMENELEKNT